MDRNDLLEVCEDDRKDDLGFIPVLLLDSDKPRLKHLSNCFPTSPNSMLLD
jgi:hypothetical protein